MSRVYRISVSERAQRQIELEDGFAVQLEVLNVLSPDEMNELLAKELEGIGFERDGKTLSRSDKDDIEIHVDLSSGQVKVTRKTAKDVDITVTRERGIEEEVLEKGKEKLREAVKEELERKVEKERGKQMQESTEILQKKLRDLQSELDGVTNRATASALKTKASQMGEIEEISENSETGEITIKVRV